MNKSAKKKYWGICFAIFLLDFILELYYLLFSQYALQTSSSLYIVRNYAYDGVSVIFELG